MKSRIELLNEARREIREMTVREAHNHLENGGDPVLLDVRGLDEWELGHLNGAVHIPRGHLEMEVESRIPDKSREVLVYCAAGVRSLLAGEALKALGYDRVISMAGGFSGWVDAGLPAAQPPALEEDGGPEDPELLSAEIEHLEGLLARKKRRMEGVKRGR